jgi:hypothetical protein
MVVRSVGAQGKAQSTGKEPNGGVLGKPKRALKIQTSFRLDSGAANLYAYGC